MPIQNTRLVRDDLYVVESLEEVGNILPVPIHIGTLSATYLQIAKMNDDAEIETRVDFTI